MGTRRVNRIPNFARFLAFCALLSGASLLLGSCGAIKTLLPGDSKGLGDPFEYALTIQYERSGMYITGTGVPDSVVFWVMPLDDNGEVTEDPENPDGPPMRYELVGTGDTGSVSAVVPYDEYAILAYIDGDGDGALELGERYEIYDNRTMRDGAFDRVLVDEDTSVDFVLDMLAYWHAVYIYTPRENGAVSCDFTAQFGALVKDGPNLRVYLNYTELTGFGYDANTGVWSVNIPESLLQLQPYMNSLRVELYDQGGNFIDNDQVYFSYYP
jgi:hypothetical protein